MSENKAEQEKPATVATEVEETAVPGAVKAAAVETDAAATEEAEEAAAVETVASLAAAAEALAAEMPDLPEAEAELATAANGDAAPQGTGDTTARLEQLSLLLHNNYEKTEQVANDMVTLADFTQQTAVKTGELSIKMQKISDEIEQSAREMRNNRFGNIASPIFLVASLVILTILMVSTFILAIHHKRLQERLDQVSRMAVKAVEQQNRKMAAFDTNFEEQLSNQLKTVRDAVGKDSSRSKLNRLRQGNEQRKLVRNSNGDWLLDGSKQELITDQEAIDALNTAFERSGRPLVPPKGMPPHSVLTYLQADGRGGTELVVTKEAVAAPQPEKQEKSAKAEKSAKPEKSVKTEKSAKSEKSAKPVKSAKSVQSEKVEQVEKPVKAEKPVQVEKPAAVAVTGQGTK